MSWSEHILALRGRIVRILIIFVLVLIVAFIFVSKIYHYFTLPLTNLHLHLVVTSPGEIVIVYMTIAMIAAVALTLPYALYEVWSFVSPGLSVRERRFVLRLLPFIAAMFIAGICFAWFVTFPILFSFLIHMTQNQGVGVYLKADSYFSFLTMICIPFGLAFELPIAILVLSWLGIVTPRFLRKIRKYAYFVIVIIGVLISPPELVSHLSVTIPMALLYELGIFVSYLTIRRQRRIQSMQEP